jgi:excisionase family DNA binding protein
MTAGVQLLTVPEAAARLRVSRATAYRLIAARELKTVDAGLGQRRTKSRIAESEIARFIADRTT